MFGFSPTISINTKQAREIAGALLASAEAAEAMDARRRDAIAKLKEAVLAFEQI